jgi:hypothetical protein
MKVQFISKHEGKIITENQVIEFDKVYEVSKEAYDKLKRLYKDHILLIEPIKDNSENTSESEDENLNRDKIISQLKELDIKFHPNTGTDKLAKLLSENI